MITNLTKSTCLAQHVQLADTPASRMRGLLNRDHLSPGEALVIVSCQSIHMLFMKFAIDVVFIDRQGIVVGLCHNIQPFHFSPIFWKADKAIELPAHTAKSSKTELGDQIQINNFQTGK